MRVIGCDYHSSWQQICWLDTTTGETEERKLEHASGEAEKFYRGLSAFLALTGFVTLRVRPDRPDLQFL
jgi:hypothetical protein